MNHLTVTFFTQNKNKNKKKTSQKFVSEIWKALKEAKNYPCCRRTILSMISLIKNSKLTPFGACKNFLKNVSQNMTATISAIC